jgi:hypothetical protein
MAKWNDIPFYEGDDPEIKALEFDLQFEENARHAEELRQNHQYPYDLDLPNRRSK